MAIIAVTIRVDTSGPVLFRQRRVGRDGEAFCIFKFRTMVDDAERLKHGLRDLNEADGLFKTGASSACAAAACAYTRHDRPVADLGLLARTA